MKIAIFYNSSTGNTALLASELKKTLKDMNVVYFGTPDCHIDADLYIIGSPTNRGICSEATLKLLESLTNKKIAYFGTAGFGGDTEYYQKLFNMIKPHISTTNEILGYFYCQGKMPLSIREKYMSSSNNNQQFLNNFDLALTHPDNFDLKEVAMWIKNIVDDIK